MLTKINKWIFCLFLFSIFFIGVFSLSTIQGTDSIDCLVYNDHP